VSASSGEGPALVHAKIGTQVSAQAGDRTGNHDAIWLLQECDYDRETRSVKKLATEVYARLKTVSGKSVQCVALVFNRTEVGSVVERAGDEVLQMIAAARVHERVPNPAGEAIRAAPLSHELQAARIVALKGTGTRWEDAIAALRCVAMKTIHILTVKRLCAEAMFSPARVSIAAV
jgi:hypothetical protein